MQIVKIFSVVAFLTMVIVNVYWYLKKTAPPTVDRQIVPMMAKPASSTASPGRVPSLSVEDGPLPASIDVVPSTLLEEIDANALPEPQGPLEQGEPDISE